MTKSMDGEYESFVVGVVGYRFPVIRWMDELGLVFY